MLRTLSLILLIFFIAQPCIAQDSSHTINGSWAKLKSEFQRRNGIVSEIVNILGKSGQFTSKELENIQTFSKYLIQHTDTVGILNHNSVLYAYLLNSRLSQVLEKSLAAFEKDPKFKNSAEARDLFFKLAAIQHRMSVLSREFNTACLKANRKDLFFGKKIIPADLKSESGTSKRTTSALKTKG